VARQEDGYRLELYCGRSGYLVEGASDRKSSMNSPQHLRFQQKRFDQRKPRKTSVILLQVIHQIHHLGLRHGRTHSAVRLPQYPPGEKDPEHIKKGEVQPSKQRSVHVHSPSTPAQSSFSPRHLSTQSRCIHAPRMHPSTRSGPCIGCHLPATAD
jgi:hypothetical protein